MHILLALNLFPEKRPEILKDRTFWVKVINNYFGDLFKVKDLSFSSVMNLEQEACWKTNHLETYSLIKETHLFRP